MENKQTAQRLKPTYSKRTIDGFFVPPIRPVRPTQPAPSIYTFSVAPQPVVEATYIADTALNNQTLHIVPVAARKTKSGIHLPRQSLFVLAVVLMVLSIPVYGHFASGHQATVKAAALTAPKRQILLPKPATDPAPVVAAPEDIAADMSTVIAAQTGLQASATLINLDNGQIYNAGNSNDVYTAASTSKLVAVFDYIHQVELGKASLTQNIGGMSGQNNIMRMIVNSDNDAWARLNRYLTFKGEQAYINSLGVSATIQQDNMQFSTPNMAKLLQLLYQGKLMNAADQVMVYGYMSHTTITNLIQAALPTNATVYHKYGQLNGDLHDASIVDYQGHHFVLVIYTNNPSGTIAQNAQQVALIHAITQTAFKDITVN